MLSHTSANYIETDYQSLVLAACALDIIGVTITLLLLAHIHNSVATHTDTHTISEYVITFHSSTISQCNTRYSVADRVLIHSW